MMYIIGIAVSALFVSLFLRDYNRTVSNIIVIAAGILIFFRVIGGISDVFDSIKEISSNVEPVSEYVKLMIKVLGITLISQFVSDLCRDCGEGALANGTEIATKVIIISMILPLFETVVNIVTGLVE